jgi:predicted DNA helicase
MTQLRRRQERGAGVPYEERKELQDYIQKLWKEARDMEFGIQREIIDGAHVVLATHGGINKQLGKKKFDLIVMDEASQATEPLSWVPITLGRKVVFAGDSCQLPPTIYSREAAEKGLSSTLFDRLKGKLPEDLQTMLRVQYRMHQDIMRFSSQKFYEDKLIADKSVKKHTAADLEGVKPSVLTERPILYVDTAGTGYNETWNELLDSRENEGEANLAYTILEQLRYSGVEPDQVAILTPYLAQVKRLRLSNREKVEIGSIDSFQGREKEVVILSLVRSNDTGEVGFLSDTRRMNVAMTRARRLLIVIGDSATISRHPFYNDFIDYVDSLDAHTSAWEWIKQ